MRSIVVRAFVVASLLAVLIPAVAISANEQRTPTQDGCRTFEETGFEVCGELLDFWESNGGLPVFGYPITAASDEVNPDTGETYLTQYFERERLELHPENEPPYNVLLGRLGDQVLELTGRDWQTFPKMDPGAEHYMDVTGFAIAPEFWEYWSNHGLEYGDEGYSFRESLLLFGYPISAPQEETNPDGDTVLTQWFERARFEFHPDNDPEHQVLLGRLGAEVLALMGEEPPDDPGDEVSVGLELVAENLTAPLTAVEAPDDSGRLYIVDQIGKIWVLMPDGTLAEQPFLDISDRLVELNPEYDERGLLGLAFHPDYAENGRFFVYYSAPLREDAPDDWNHTNVLSEFHVSADDPMVADPASEQVLLAVDWPYSNHNGGTVAFGPEDGYLYLSMGDGGRADDTGRGHVEDWYDVNEGGNAQDVEQNLLGSIHRIDVDSTEGDLAYGIPDDNPFVGRDGNDEIYAYGFRNPYRFSFDMGGEHRMFVGDAGQNLWEEVSVVDLGGNYGWNVYEGTHCFSTENPDVSLDDCPDTVGEGHPDAGAPLIPPVIEFANAQQPDGLGQTVVGGYVYRAGEIDGLEGRYVFAVWSVAGGTDATAQPGAIFFAEEADEGLWDIHNLIDAETFGHHVVGFGQDSEGNVYVMATDTSGPSGNTGKVYRLVPSE